MASNFGKCHCCGFDAHLTFEHIPPKAAFNSGGGRSANMQAYFESEDLHPDNVRTSKNRKGFGRYTLCAKCNNDTGAWYGPEYINWAYQGARFRGLSGKLAMPFHIFPGRIMKQLICMFGSACGAGFFDAHPHLRRFVLNRDIGGLPPKLRVYCFLMTTESTVSRQSGIVGMMNRATHVFSEISFPPFGYILSIDSSIFDPGLFDITFFADSGFNDFRTLHLPIPSRDVNTYFPGDFRSKEEWDKALDSTRKKPST